MQHNYQFAPSNYQQVWDHAPKKSFRRITTKFNTTRFNRPQAEFNLRHGWPPTTRAQPRRETSSHRIGLPLDHEHGAIRKYFQSMLWRWEFCLDTKQELCSICSFPLLSQPPDLVLEAYCCSSHQMTPQDEKRGGWGSCLDSQYCMARCDKFARWTILVKSLSYFFRNAGQYNSKTWLWTEMQHKRSTGSELWVWGLDSATVLNIPWSLSFDIKKFGEHQYKTVPVRVQVTVPAYQYLYNSIAVCTACTRCPVRTTRGKMWTFGAKRPGMIDNTRNR